MKTIRLVLLALLLAFAANASARDAYSVDIRIGTAGYYYLPPPVPLYAPPPVPIYAPPQLYYYGAPQPVYYRYYSPPPRVYYAPPAYPAYRGGVHHARPVHGHAPARRHR